MKRTNNSILLSNIHPVEFVDLHTILDLAVQKSNIENKNIEAYISRAI